MTTVAALYVDVARGPYATMPGVECWGVERDATRYAGPYPCVVHPPCGHWGRYAHKAHDDGHAGPIAVAQVRRWGGVLEHPRDSRLWAHCGLPLPGEFPDAFGGYTILVRQCDWGHRAEKPTFLYIVGCPVQYLPPMPPRIEVDAPAWMPSRRRLTDRETTRPRGSRGVLERMSKATRHLTTPDFAAWLVELARRCRVAP